MSTGNQDGNSVAFVNTGAGSHICMKQLAVSHTRFLVCSGVCGLMVLFTYELWPFPYMYEFLSEQQFVFHTCFGGSGCSSAGGWPCL